MIYTPTAIDLFSGCGGISTGLLDAGILVPAGFDFDRRSIEAFNYNHTYRKSIGFIQDLSKISGNEILRLAQLKRVDLIVGGPPCQSFSIAGKQQGTADNRGNLVFDFIRLVGEIKPEVFMFENVPNIEKFDGGKLIQEMYERLSSHGYSINSKILFAPDYGVAQIRRRLIIIGVRDKTALDFPPTPTHSSSNLDLFSEKSPYLTCFDVLNDLPDVTEEAARMIPNHEPTMHSEGMLAAFAALAPGKRDKKSFHDRLHPERQSYTLRAGGGNFSPLRPVHYKYDRVITVRESARIQSFSDDFIWPDSIPRLQQYRQVGNAVPPLLAKAVGLSIAKQLGWKINPEETHGDAASRAEYATRTLDERIADRKNRTRGASLGRKNTKITTNANQC